MNNLTFSRRLLLGIATIVAILVILAVVAFSASGRTKTEMNGLTDDHLPHLIKGQQIFNEANTIARSLRNMQIIGFATAEDKNKANEEWSRVLESRGKIKELLEQMETLAKAIDDQEAFKDLAKIKEKRAAFIEAQNKYKALFDAGDVVGSRAFVMGELRDSFNVYRDVILSMNQQEQEGALTSANDLKKVAGETQTEILIAAGIGILLAVVVAVMLLRRVRQQLGGELEVLQGAIERIASGDLSQDVLLLTGDTNNILAKVQAMQLKLRAASKLADENARVRVALDSVSTSVMIADADRNIIYCNRAQDKLLQVAEADLRKDLPQFSARTVIGSNIDGFHKNPAHQRGMLERLHGEHKAKLTIGGRQFSLTINPVVDTNQVRNGYVVEWVDQTELFAQLEKEQIANDERARILGALEATSTNVMIADADRNIIYMNKAVTSMLSRVESELRKVLPTFNVSKLIGTNMDG